MRSFLKNRRISPNARQNFHFQKKTETLKMNIFLKFQQPSFGIKEQLSKKFKIRICLVLFFFKNGENGFWGFLRPCEAMGQVKKQQIKVKFWSWGPRTVDYNMTCAQQNFKNHSTLLYMSGTRTADSLYCTFSEQKLLTRSPCFILKLPTYFTFYEIILQTHFTCSKVHMYTMESIKIL